MDLASWENISERDLRSPSPDILTTDDELDVPVNPSFAMSGNRPTNMNKLVRGNPNVIGRRKQRRFENEMLLLWAEGEEENAADFDNNNESCTVLSMFETLRKENPKLYESFIQGEQMVLVQRNGRHLNRDEQRKYQTGLFRINRNIRKHVQRQTTFVESVEKTLFENLSKAGDEKQDELVFVLPLETAFQRLLAHGVAQFYNIVSFSSGAGVRFTISKSNFDRNLPRLSTYLQH